jgi:hypothetical protein
MESTTAPRTKRAARLTLALLVAAIVMTTVPATPAAAYQMVTAGHSPGRVTAYQVQGSHYNSCVGMYYTCFTPWVVGTGPMVYRSPATTATQKVGVQYILQRWNGSSWSFQSQRTHTAFIPAGYNRVQMPRVDFLPNRGGYFRLLLVVAWSNANETRGFGSRSFVYNHSGDYVCNTRFPCQVGAGNVWLRSPGV